MDNKIKAALLGIIIVVAALPLAVRVVQGQPQTAPQTAGHGTAQSNAGAASGPATTQALPQKTGVTWQRAFEADPGVIGAWTVVDFVRNVDDFQPGKKGWTGAFAFDRLVFNADGYTSGPWLWTKGYLWHPGDQAEAAYLIKEMNGTIYLFMAWMSSDVLIRGEKPHYYVLTKEPGQ